MTQFFPRRYLRRPVTISALRYTPATCGVIHQWMDEPHLAYDDDGDPLCGGDLVVGDFPEDVAVVGDWVCRDVEGFFAVSDDVFQRMYLPLRRGWVLRRWLITAVAVRADGAMVHSSPMSRHLTVRGARRAVARYASWPNPNPKLSILYEIGHVQEVRS